jgi:hypothetical protein
MAVALLCVATEAHVASRGVVTPPVFAESSKWADSAFAAMEDYDCTKYKPSQHDGAADKAARARRRMEARRLASTTRPVTKEPVLGKQILAPSTLSPSWGTGTIVVGVSVSTVIGLAAWAGAYRPRAVQNDFAKASPMTGDILSDI